MANGKGDTGTRRANAFSIAGGTGVESRKGGGTYDKSSSSGSASTSMISGRRSSSTVEKSKASGLRRLRGGVGGKTSSGLTSLVGSFSLSEHNDGVVMSVSVVDIEGHVRL